MELLRTCFLAQQEQINQLILGGGGGIDPQIPRACTNTPNSEIINTGAFSTCNVTSEACVTLETNNLTTDSSTYNAFGDLILFCDGVAVHTQPYGQTLTFPPQTSDITQKIVVNLPAVACTGSVSMAFANQQVNYVSGAFLGVADTYDNYCASAFCTV